MVNSCFPFALFNGITFAIVILFGNIPDVSDILHNIVIAEWLNYVRYYLFNNGNVYVIKSCRIFIFPIIHNVDDL